AGYQSFKLARLRGMHNGDAEPSCQVTRSLPEKGSHERLVVRLLRRHRMPQVPPARSADDEIHFADEPARGLGTDQFPAQGRAHGTGGRRGNARIPTPRVKTVFPHCRPNLFGAVILPTWGKKEKAVEAVSPRLGEERAADDAVVLARELPQQLQGRAFQRQPRRKHGRGERTRGRKELRKDDPFGSTAKRLADQ